MYLAFIWLFSDHFLQGFKWTQGKKERDHSSLPPNQTTDASKGGSGVWDELGDWDWHICTAMYKIDN